MSFWDDSSAPVELDRKGRAKRERAGLFVVVGVVLGLVVVLALAYAATYAVAGDRVPHGVVISGVDVGGKGHDQAVEAVEIAFRERANRPIVLAAADATGAERTVSLTPAQIGLHVDAEASVAATGAVHSWRPDRLWSFFNGGDRRDAVVTLDRDALVARIRTMRGGFGAPPVNARVVFTKHGPHVVPGQAGDAVNLAAAQQAIEAAYLDGATQAHVALAAAQPDISLADADDALGSYARPAMSGPVGLRFGSTVVRLRPEQYAGALAMVDEGGKLVPAVRRTKLLALVRTQRRSIEPHDATIRLVHGRPTVVPSRPGLAFTDDAIVAAFRRSVAASGARRTVTVAARKAQPGFTTAEARALKVKEQIAAASTYFPADADNRRVAALARRLNGRLVRPGTMLSLDHSASPLVMTVAQAGFFGGLVNLDPDRVIVFDAASTRDAGRLRLKNTSRYGVLVSAVTTPATPGHPGRLTVRLYSTRAWAISARKGVRADPVPAGERADYSPGCHPAGGHGGYVLKVTRVFRRPGGKAVDHTDATFRWLYPPVPRVVCG